MQRVYYLSMGMKHVSGIVCYVEDLVVTKDFYTRLGFQVDSQDNQQVSLSLNGFWFDCIEAVAETKSEFQAEAASSHKGAGLYIYIEVDDVDVFYKSVIDAEMKPSSEPKDWPWGNREFVFRDPDGYKLVFFCKIKK
jgi:catechol 2,3-dioxygenase-like lactoylglutathione lyase family enzyme